MILYPELSLQAMPIMICRLVPIGITRLDNLLNPQNMFSLQFIKNAAAYQTCKTLLSKASLLSIFLSTFVLFRYIIQNVCSHINPDCISY